MHLRVRRRLLSMAIAISLLPLPVAAIAIRLHRLCNMTEQAVLHESRYTNYGHRGGTSTYAAPADPQTPRREIECQR